jgi:hypothetical protein
MERNREARSSLSPVASVGSNRKPSTDSMSDRTILSRVMILDSSELPGMFSRGLYRAAIIPVKKESNVPRRVGNLFAFPRS